LGKYMEFWVTPKSRVTDINFNFKSFQGIQQQTTRQF
jgi:hypothetical protein